MSKIIFILIKTIIFVITVPAVIVLEAVLIVLGASLQERDNEQ